MTVGCHFLHAYLAPANPTWEDSYPHSSSLGWEWADKQNMNCIVGMAY